jgi:hypothetical protein
MNSSVFFLAAAADSLVHSLRLCLQRIAFALRPAPLLLAIWVQLGCLPQLFLRGVPASDVVVRRIPETRESLPD